ncbi:MAG: DNA polymerase III subunit epsilon [Gammaproteobacteria bacterium]|nr:DNA polymerase III subunit epsilon [Gammaproteobacteria bacterium]
MRQVVLDTETTGLDPARGHRVIEIGCVEYVNRRATGATYHTYLNPEREIEEGAIAVHGISNDFVADKPLFKDIVEQFLEFVDGAELIIHNAPFDIGFLDMELKRLKKQFATMAIRCQVLDTLEMARERHPGQRNSLDALCKRYEIDNSSRVLHGALLDAQILGDVYLAMTGGQASLSLGASEEKTENGDTGGHRMVARDGLHLVVIAADAQELAAHERKLDEIEKSSGQPPRWRQSEPAS